MPMAKERPMKSSRARVLYRGLSEKSHELGEFRFILFDLQQLASKPEAGAWWPGLLLCFFAYRGAAATRYIVVGRLGLNGTARVGAQRKANERYFSFISFPRHTELVDPSPSRFYSAATDCTHVPIASSNWRP
jgi:hypothetical protein